MFAKYYSSCWFSIRKPSRDVKLKLWPNFIVRGVPSNDENYRISCRQCFSVLTDDGSNNKTSKPLRFGRMDYKISPYACLRQPAERATCPAKARRSRTGGIMQTISPFAPRRELRRDYSEKTFLSFFRYKKRPAEGEDQGRGSAGVWH